jgi:hypothetical protein
MGKQKNRNKQTVPTTAPDSSRRKFMLLGAGAVGALGLGAAAAFQAGFFDGTPAVPAATTPAAPAFKLLPPVSLPPDYANALRVAEDITSHYTRELQTPSAMIHAVRGFGRDFTLYNGTKAVDYLCATTAAEREVNGKRYVYFQRSAEVHENSFLKTFLEAGVSPDQVIRVGQNQYTLQELGEHGKALFRCDPTDLSRYEPKLLEEHLPWCFTAFSTLVPPNPGTWTNAYGEKIDFHQVIDRALASYETMCEGVSESLAHGEVETVPFRQAITKHSCYGLHTVYGFFACYRHGYRRNNLPQRIKQLLDLTINRMAGDAQAIDREAESAKSLGPDVLNRIAVSQEGKVVTNGSPPAQLVEAMRLRSQIKLQGHILEAINYGRLNKLYVLTPDQQKRVQAGEQALYDNLIKLRMLDLDALRRWHSKFVSDTVISVGHAVRALKLLTPNNPDAGGQGTLT